MKSPLAATVVLAVGIGCCGVAMAGPKLDLTVRNTGNFAVGMPIGNGNLELIGGINLNLDKDKIADKGYSQISTMLGVRDTFARHGNLSLEGVGRIVFDSYSGQPAADGTKSHSYWLGLAGVYHVSDNWAVVAETSLVHQHYTTNTTDDAYTWTQTVWGLRYSL